MAVVNKGCSRIFFVQVFRNKIRRQLPVSQQSQKRWLAAVAADKRRTKLVEVGKFEDQRTEDYSVGQHFLHRIFGYRGVILYPWSTKVYDRDVSDEHQVEKRASPGVLQKNQHNVRGQMHTYYSVLIDENDWPYVTTYARYLEPTSHSGHPDGNQIIRTGFDHVAHEDILPYSGTQPVTHSLFSSFFSVGEGQDPPYVGKEFLKSWTKRNSEFLPLSDVHRKTTEGIRVTAIPFYMGPYDNNKSNVYIWRYVVRLENFNNETVTLRERHWRVYSVSGRLEEFKGKGVVGHEPVLSKMYRAYQYSSRVPLHSPSGHMWGSFTMEREIGERFKVEIPAFTLESKLEDVTETIFA